MIPLLLAMIRVKNAIDLMPRYQKKEEFTERKMENLLKLPIEDQMGNI